MASSPRAFHASGYAFVLCAPLPTLPLNIRPYACASLQPLLTNLLNPTPPLINLQDLPVHLHTLGPEDLLDLRRDLVEVVCG